MVIARFRGISRHSGDLTARLKDDEIKSHEISVSEGVLFKKDGAVSGCGCGMVGKRGRERNRKREIIYCNNFAN